MIRAVLFDLDGVLRHFDHSRAVAVAARHGLTLADLHRAAFGPALLGQLVTGRITRARWVETVGRTLGDPAAARDWLADIGTIDPQVLGLVHQLRDAGLRCAILTNGTDTIREELDTLDISHGFHPIVSTSDLGVAKPHSAAFLAAAELLELPPEAVFFTDDKGPRGCGRSDPIGPQRAGRAPREAVDPHPQRTRRGRPTLTRSGGRLRGMSESAPVPAWTGLALAVALIWAPVPGVVALLFSVDAHQAAAEGDTDRAIASARWAKIACLASIAAGAVGWPLGWLAAVALGWA